MQIVASSPFKCHNYPISFPVDSGDICKDVLQDKALAGYNDVWLYDIDSAEDCWYLCVAHTDFVCNSVEYFVNPDSHLYQQCILTVETSYSAPGPFNGFTDCIMIERCEP